MPSTAGPKSVIGAHTSMSQQRRSAMYSQPASTGKADTKRRKRKAKKRA